MKRLLVLTSMVCFVPVSVGANQQVPGQVVNHCEKVLTDETPELTPEVLQALKAFPNFTREWFFKFERNFQQPSYADLSQINPVSNHVTFLQVSDLPVEFMAFGSGLYSETHVDLSSLVGQAVIGYFDQHKERVMVDGKPGDARMERYYFSGQVESYFKGERDNTTPEDRHPRIEHFQGFMLRTPQGELRKVEFGPGHRGVPDAYILTLVPQTTEEQIVRESMRTSKIEALVESAFGSPTTREGYDMAWAVVETTLAVPPSYGSSAVIKILLGRKVRGGESYPHFALARGKKRYNEAALTKFIAPLDAYMEFAGIFGAPMEPARSDDTKKNAPDWVRIRYKNSRAETFRQVWQEIVAAKGGGSKEIVLAKERPADSVKVTSQALVPGAMLVVKDKIGYMKADENLPALAIFEIQGAPTFTDASFGVPPKGRLEVLSKPRKLDGVNMVRVKEVTTGKEGEVFLKTLMVSTELVFSGEE